MDRDVCDRLRRELLQAAAQFHEALKALVMACDESFYTRGQAEPLTGLACIASQRRWLESCADLSRELDEELDADLLSWLARTTPAQHEGYQRMPYREFLGTEYWRVASTYVKRKIRACRCGEGRMSRLQVHHLSYEHRGAEHLHLEDLQVLCDPCHALAHGLPPRHG